MLDQANSMVEAAIVELERLPPEAQSLGELSGSLAANGVLSKQGAMAEAARAVKIAEILGLGSGDTSAVGFTDGQNYIGGLKSVDTWTPASLKAGEAKAGFESVDANPSGYNFAAGFANGISSYPIGKKAANFGISAVIALNNSLGIQSPSRETYKSGDFYGQGFENAVIDSMPRIQKTCELAAQSYLEPFQDISEEDFSFSMTEHLNRQLEISTNSRLSQDFSSVLEPIQSGTDNLAGKIAEAIKNQSLTMVLDNREIGRIRR